jgi:hypothetical protein
MTLRQLFVAAGLLVVLLSPLAQDAMLVASCGGVLALVGLVLLPDGNPPIAALVVLYQWLQVSAALLYANLRGESLVAYYPVGDVERATAYGYLGLAIASIATGLVLRRFRPTLDALRIALEQFSVVRLAQVYAVLALVGLPLERLFGVGSQVAQLFQGIGNLRWVMLLLLIAASLVQRRGVAVAFLILGLEVVIGFSGYFAGFAVPLLVAMMGFAGAYGLLRSHQRAGALVLALVMLGLGVVWQGVKNEYRREVSGGSDQQVVTVGLGERYALLGRMAGETVEDDLSHTLEKFALRLAYVEYLGLVVHRVPAELPHREGELLGAALSHIFMPRLLFPDKPALPSDSELTSYYTANVFLLYRTGTSISLGYLTELYIDFGVAGVLLAGLLLAGLVGGVCFAFARLVPDPALASALSASVLLSARLFEVALPKLLGGVLSVFLVQLAVVWLLRGWVLPVLRGVPLASIARAREAA